MFCRLQSVNVIAIKLFRKTALLEEIASDKPKLQTISNVTIQNQQVYNLSNSNLFFKT
jgi:hypothetical protein